MKFHFNPDTGRKGVCEATIKSCPLVHGSSPEEAVKNYEKIMSDQNLTLTSFTKSTKNSQQGFLSAKNDTIGNPSFNGSSLRRTPLKDLQAGDLAKVIKSEAQDLGMNLKKVSEAIDLATALHAHQTRGPRWQNGELMKKVPYIEHPLRNSLRLMRLGVEDQDIVNAAILHDTVEDGSTVYAKKYLNKEMEEVEARKALSAHIEKSYGINVSKLVEAVTNEYVPTKKVQSMTMEERRRVYRDHVDQNIKNNPGALMVKVSDFIDNATGLYHNDIKGQEKGTYKRAMKYLPVVKIFKNRMNEVKLPISEENLQVIYGQLDRTTVRLSDIVKKYDYISS